jgi:NitT/TauT family transport system permease protein
MTESLDEQTSTAGQPGSTSPTRCEIRPESRRPASSLFAVRQDIPAALATALPIALFAVLLAFWTIVTALGWTNSLFLPSPEVVLSTAWQLFAVDGLLGDVAISVYRVLVGFGVAAAIAVPLGVVMGSLHVCRCLFEPFLAFIRYMPATAFIPLLVLWLGIGDVQKFAVIYVGTFFHLCLLVMGNALSVSLPLIETAQMLGATRWQQVTRVIWPAARPGIFDNLRIVLGWAWTYIVVAEIVAADSGIGFVILRASRFLDTATIFVGIVSIGLVGILSDLVFNKASQALFPYLERARG